MSAGALKQLQCHGSTGTNPSESRPPGFLGFLPSLGRKNALWRPATLPNVAFRPSAPRRSRRLLAQAGFDTTC